MRVFAQRLLYGVLAAALVCALSPFQLVPAFAQPEEEPVSAAQEEAGEASLPEEGEAAQEDGNGEGLEPLANEGEPAEVPQGVYGTGSAQLNETDSDYRFFSEYYILRTKNGTVPQTAGIDRKTRVNVYLNAGETAYFGSSVSDSVIDVNDVSTSSATGADIVVTAPDGTVTPYDVIANGAGYIANVSQEHNGPQLNSADGAERYQPLSFTADATGVYSFAFHSKNGLIAGVSGDSPTPTVAGAGSWAQGNGTVAAWDITVVGANAAGDGLEVKPGRMWADYLAVTTGGGADYRSSLQTYILTNDGYTYQVDLNELAPFGFIFFANNTGFTTTGATPYSLYHSFAGDDADLSTMEANELVTLHRPGQADTDTQQTFKVFFERPGSDLPTSIKPVPQAPSQVTDLRFSGVAPGIANYGQGGVFTFNVDHASSVTIKLDLRTALEHLRASASADDPVNMYTGSGVVELNGAVRNGFNSFVWDGTDTVGQMVPVGLYESGDFDISAESKAGEIHFPLIDVEGMYGGITVRRLDGSADGSTDLYYNNSPLAFGSIEGTPGVKTGSYFELSDGTRSVDANRSHFQGVDARSISTLVADSSSEGFATTYHHEPVASDEVSMRFNASGNYGGGNSAGIDTWTYYQGPSTESTISSDLAIIGPGDTGTVSGMVFYDEDHNGAYSSTAGDAPLNNMSVILTDAQGVPFTYTTELPLFDAEGRFLRNPDGSVVTEQQTLTYEVQTDVAGRYTFTGVPFGTECYVQVLLSHVQVNVLEYVPTTAGNSAASDCGPDGNKVSDSLLGGYEFELDVFGNVQFSAPNAQSFTLSQDQPQANMLSIGYTSEIPIANQKTLQVRKVWDGDAPVDNITVELWYWDASGDGGRGVVSSRSGELVDTVRLSQANSWSYSWTHLDDRYQYYVVEYYTKLDADGNVMLDDQGNERLVLIGGTMPAYATTMTGTYASNGLLAPDVENADRAVEFYGDGVVHTDASTELEKQSTIDNDAMLFDVSYTLTTADYGKTRVVTLTNAQTYDEREYYTWLGHESVLPGFATISSALQDARVVEFTADGEGIAGLTVTDADTGEDVTASFRFCPDDPASVLYTPSGQTGTRTLTASYNGASWTVTIHVYNAEDDGVISYEIEDAEVPLQQGLALGEELEWSMGPNGYASNDTRDGLFANDVNRVELGPHTSRAMTSDAEIVGIAYAPEGPVEDVSALTFVPLVDGAASVEGSSGTLHLESSNTARVDGQDGMNYVSAGFTPGVVQQADTFYYKIAVYGQGTGRDTDADAMSAAQGVVMYACFTVEPNIPLAGPGGSGGPDSPGGSGTPAGPGGSGGPDSPGGSGIPAGPDTSGGAPVDDPANHVPRTGAMEYAGAALLALAFAAAAVFAVSRRRQHRL